MKFRFVWADKWIGLFHKTREIPSQGIFDVYRTDWYVCIIPCLPIQWTTTRVEIS